VGRRPGSARRRRTPPAGPRSRRRRVGGPACGWPVSPRAPRPPRAASARRPEGEGGGRGRRWGKGQGGGKGVAAGVSLCRPSPPRPHLDRRAHRARGGRALLVVFQQLPGRDAAGVLARCVGALQDVAPQGFGRRATRAVRARAVGRGALGAVAQEEEPALLARDVVAALRVGRAAVGRGRWDGARGAGDRAGGRHRDHGVAGVGGAGRGAGGAVVGLGRRGGARGSGRRARAALSTRLPLPPPHLPTRPRPRCAPPQQDGGAVRHHRAPAAAVARARGRRGGRRRAPGARAAARGPARGRGRGRGRALGRGGGGGCLGRLALLDQAPAGGLQPGLERRLVQVLVLKQRRGGEGCGRRLGPPPLLSRRLPARARADAAAASPALSAPRSRPRTARGDRPRRPSGAHGPAAGAAPRNRPAPLPPPPIFPTREPADRSRHASSRRAKSGSLSLYWPPAPACCAWNRAWLGREGGTAWAARGRAARIRAARRRGRGRGRAALAHPRTPRLGCARGPGGGSRGAAAGARRGARAPAPRRGDPRTPPEATSARGRPARPTKRRARVARAPWRGEAAGTGAQPSSTRTSTRRRGAGAR